MSPAKKVNLDELRLSAADFDRMLRQVLSVKPKAKKGKKAPAKKPKKAR